jgi:signal transduction histidine kinase
VQTGTTAFYTLIILAMIVSLLMGLTIVLFFIRYRTRLLKQQQKAQAAALQHQQDLLSATIESEERERKRIGRDLHDEVGTALTHIRMYIERHLPEVNDPQFINTFGSHTKMQIDKIIHDVRNISHYLSPESIDLYGFSAAVEELVEVCRESSGITCSLINEADAILVHLDQTQSLALYRVLKELLTNTIKHAEADLVSITMQVKDDLLTITYKDNGRGLPSGQTLTKGIGLKNIESRLQLIRATTHWVEPGAGGFNMHITLPLKIFSNDKSVI